MKLGIVGGVLQGMEATYLAKKAGYETLVVDRWEDAPALSLADEGMVMDVVEERDLAVKVLGDCDAILPANENLETLTRLHALLDGAEVPLLFDLKAYELSSSKLLSNQLMESMDIPLPRPFPECGFPVVVKPSGQSGSVGVTRADSPEELEIGIQAVRGMGDDVIIQEFVEGPNISIEVIGDGNSAVPMMLTEVVLDGDYDCRMVRCPLEGVDPELERDFACVAKRMAEEMHLRGIMDVEAIVSGDSFKVLEIDARIPSQTPAAIYHATGVNLVQRLVDALVRGRLDDKMPLERGAAVYEHVAIDNWRIRSCGEGSFSEVRLPLISPGLFGADEIISDYEPGKESWRGTVMCSGRTPGEAWGKRIRCIREMARTEGLSGVEEMIE